MDHVSISQITGLENNKSDKALHLTHLPISQFIKNFNTSFPQWEILWLLLLPRAENNWLLMMMHTKWLPWDSPLPHWRITATHGYSGKPLYLYANDTRYQGDTRSYTITPDLCWSGAIWGALNKEKSHPKGQNGEIPPIREADLWGSGDHRPLTQHHGRPQLSARRKAYILCAQRPPPAPPYWFLPLPILLLHCFDATDQIYTSMQQGIPYLYRISFFFLLWPSEYFQGYT